MMENITIVDVQNKIISFFRQEPIRINKDKTSVGISIKLDDLVHFMRVTDRTYALSTNYKDRTEQYIQFCELLIPGIYRKNVKVMRYDGADTIEYQIKLKHIFYKEVSL